MLAPYVIDVQVAILMRRARAVGTKRIHMSAAFGCSFAGVGGGDGGGGVGGGLGGGGRGGGGGGGGLGGAGGGEGVLTSPLAPNKKSVEG
eukprot:scaffold1878_cov355-Prasinococcus_capsulatus_cf.AAC.4